jgi:hypothetical protein
MDVGLNRLVENRDLLILGIAAIFALFLGGIFKLDVWVMCWSGFALGWYLAKRDGNSLPPA